MPAISASCGSARRSSRSLYVGALPDATWFGWLEEALAVPRPFVLCVHVARARPADRAAQAARQASARVGHQPRPRSRVEAASTPTRARRRPSSTPPSPSSARAQRAQPFEVSIYQAIREPGPDPDPAELAGVCDRAARALAAAGDVTVHRGALRQLDLWRSTLPLGHDHARRRQLYFTRHVADTLPLVASGAGSPHGHPGRLLSSPGETVQRLNFWDPAHDEPRAGDQRQERQRQDAVHDRAGQPAALPRRPGRGDRPRRPLRLPRLA